MATHHSLRSDIHRNIRQALATIKIYEERQKLSLECPNIILDGVNSLCITNFLRQYPWAVSRLQLCFAGFSVQAVEILREFLIAQASSSPTTTLKTLKIIHIQGNLGNNNSGARSLLSSLYGNQYIQELQLHHVGLMAGTGGGGCEVISTLMPNSNSRFLTNLIFSNENFGVQGARALQAGIRANDSLRTLGLTNCRLGDEGLSLIVDVMIEKRNTTAITNLSLVGNRITASAGLPHVTRLLDNAPLSLKYFNLDKNPGLFENEENTRQFATLHFHDLYR